MYFAYIYLALKLSVMIGQVGYDVRVSPSMKTGKERKGKRHGALGLVVDQCQ